MINEIHVEYQPIVVLAKDNGGRQRLILPIDMCSLEEMRADDI